MDLAKFLNDRLDEDQAAAKAAFGPGIALNWPALPAAVDVFIDRYGPLRAVREVEAKRKILHLAYEATGLDLQVDQEFRVGMRDEEAEPLIGDLIKRALAAVWSDHPDFDPAWKE